MILDDSNLPSLQLSRTWSSNDWVLYSPNHWELGQSLGPDNLEFPSGYLT
jgi:hypothetical protein